MTNAEISERVAKLFDQIKAAADRDALVELYDANKDVWTERHTMASQRQLEAVAS